MASQKMFTIFLIAIAITSCLGGAVPAVPAAVSVPYASSYTASVVNHGIATPFVPAAPLVAAPAPVARLTSAPLTAALPAAYSALPAAYNTLPAAYSSLPAAYSALPAAYNALPAAYNALPAAYNALPAAYSALPAAYSALPGAYAGLSAAYSALPAPVVLRK